MTSKPIAVRLANRRVGPAWTPEDEEILRQDIPYDMLPDDFKRRRSRDACRHHRRRLGLVPTVPVFLFSDRRGRGGDDRFHDTSFGGADRASDNALPVLSPRLERDSPTSDEDWEELFGYIEATNEKRGTMSESTKHVDWKAPVGGPIGIAFFSDLHAGSGGVLYQQFKADMETLSATDGLYGIFNGDAFENTKPQSKSGSALYTSVFANPKEQFEYVKRRALVAKGKWVAWTQGNHDAWDYRHAGIDRLPDLTQALECPYATESGVTISASVGENAYTIVAKHDYRGKSQINKSNSGRRLYLEFPSIMDQITADIVALAHLHEPDMHTSMMRGYPVTMLRSGSYKVKDQWAETAGYKPQYGVPLVILYPEAKQVVPFMDFETGVRFLKAERGR